MADGRAGAPEDCAATLPRCCHGRGESRRSDPETALTPQGTIVAQIALDCRPLLPEAFFTKLYDVVETHVDQDGVASADLERPQGGVVARGRCAAFVVVTRESANELVLRVVHALMPHKREEPSMRKLD